MAGNITFTMIKPGAVSHEYIGPILNMINDRGYHIVAMRYLWMSKKEAEMFYAVHKDRAFFQNLIDFITSGPVVAAILQKENAVEDYRKLIGSTDPAKAEEGTIRKIFAESIERNAVHGSDSDENAKIESDFFFARFDRFYLEDF
ncbi:MAG: nucleoside-diphosphate kinase [Bacteroidota bacterium]